MKTRLALLLASALGITGCGAAPNSTCTTIPVLGVYPAIATASSSATSPANQVQFTSSITYTGSSPKCPVPALAVQVFPTWSNPDPTHITISSAADQTNGIAVCNGPTTGAVTLTATTTYGSPAQTLTATVQLTCN